MGFHLDPNAALNGAAATPWRRGLLDRLASVHALCLWAGLVGASACGGSTEKATLCTSPKGETSTRSFALRGGSATADYLGLNGDERSAIVRLDLDPTGNVLCSGVVIGTDWVLTAAHCLRELPAPLEEGYPVVGWRNTAGDPATAATLDVQLHDTLDLALIEAIPRGDEVLPSPLPIGEVDESTELLQLAGYGFSGSTELGGLQFAVEEIVNTDGAEIVVSAGGFAGACFGDSGGPALTRDSRGRTIVVGVLSQGSTTCSGLDRYVRLNAARAWFDAIVPAAGTQNDAEVSCPDFGHEGRCFGSTAIWCDDGTTMASDCGDTENCGWKQQVSGYRCIAPSSDPCDGVSEFGRCDDGAAVFCDRGVLERDDCTLCSATCARHTVSGRVVCAVLD